MLKIKIVLMFCCALIVISALVKTNPVQNNYDFPIAGGHSVEECMEGKRPKHWNSEMYITTTELARSLGYRAEEHVVVTEDGYILTLHRIRGRDGARPIFLQHGLFGSSFDFVMSGKDNALAFILAKNGYDVWLGNCRSNTYSMCHTKYTASEFIFWDYSWHEIGVFDLPAQISYVTNVTKQDIIYVGFSMGTTVSYVMAIERPDIASKIKALFSLAPVAYFYNIRDPIQVVASFVRIFEILAKVTGGKIPTPPKKLIKYLCSFTLIQKKFCATVLFFFFGYDYQYFNFNLMPTIGYHSNTISFKTLNHFLHERNSGRFMYYDYGRDENLRMYNSTEAPDYNITKINVPVGIFWSTNDYVAGPEDVQRFYKQLPNKILSYKVENPKFNHLDFVASIDARKSVYPKLLSVMEGYR